MKRKVLAVGIILLFVGIAMAPSVNFTAVNASNNDKRENKTNQKDLLFQTIIDIANNKEIQGIIFKSQLSKSGFFHPDVKFSIFNPSVVTKNQLKQMYVVGLLLSKFISKSRMHSLIERYQVNNPMIQKEITAVIEKDATLNGEITQLSNSNCNCGGSSGVAVWHFPVICTILNILLFVFEILFLCFHYIGGYAIEVIAILMTFLNCPIWKSCAFEN